MPNMFQRGGPVTFRDVYAGRIKAAVSFVTVEHTTERFVGWLPEGAQFALPVDASGSLVKDVMTAHELKDLTWAMPGSPGQLMVAPAGSMFSVVVRFFGGNWHMPEWYVNLQAPLTRTEIGFDSTDYVLDLVVAADGSSWRWKDEDEFEAAVNAGFMTREREKTIRACGLEALERARLGGAPFDAEFLQFRPAPAWALPRLAAGWRELPVRT